MHVDIRRGQEFAFFLHAKQGNAFCLATGLATAAATTTVLLNWLRMLACSEAARAN